MEVLSLNSDYSQGCVTVEYLFPGDERGSRSLMQPGVIDGGIINICIYILIYAYSYNYSPDYKEILSVSNFWIFFLLLTQQLYFEFVYVIGSVYLLCKVQFFNLLRNGNK